jgi:hypothetical protein
MEFVTMARDDFSHNTKTLLAKRAGYLCSKPGCRVLTIGPGLESTEGVASVGVAAHITGASSEGPRYDAALSSEQRVAIENGIWLCATHAALIDRDVARFTVQVLHEWKRQHEIYVCNAIGEMQPQTAVARLGGKTISNEAARIAANRPQRWGERLFIQLIRDEIKRSTDRARDLKYNITLDTLRVVEPGALIDALTTSCDDARKILHAFVNLMHDALAEARTQEDPDLIVYVATRIGDIYTKVVDWGLAWNHTKCPWIETKRLLSLLPKVMCNIQATIEGISNELDMLTDLALASDKPNETIKLAVTFTVPGAVLEEIENELNRLHALAIDLNASGQAYEGGDLFADVDARGMAGESER